MGGPRREPHRTGRPYAEGSRQRAADLYAEGRSARQVARMLGVGVSFVLDAARRAGVDRPVPRGPAAVTITRQGALDRARDLVARGEGGQAARWIRLAESLRDGAR